MLPTVIDIGNDNKKSGIIAWSVAETTCKYLKSYKKFYWSRNVTKKKKLQWIVRLAAGSKGRRRYGNPRAEARCIVILAMSFTMPIINLIHIEMYFQ